jgi:ornithine cyclodeaminase/alanine dehydrogenase-like protein (mu-crystallin family)
VDNWSQCKHRGELRKLAERGAVTEANITAEIGEVVAGLKPGRESEKERILAVPVGMGSQDVAIASKVYKKAIEKGLGAHFKFMNV